MSTTTRVVNLRHELYDVYIGRAGHGLDGYFGNPILVGERCDECGRVHGEAGATLFCYRKYLVRRLDAEPEFAARVAALKGKRLGCFCVPKPCHGHMLAMAAEGLPR